MLSSPIMTVLAMAKVRSIGVMTITFFCAQYMNCCVWAMYGVQKRAPPVIICNTLGIVIATYCILTFVTVARLEEQSGNRLKSTTYKATATMAAATCVLGLFLLCLIILLYNVAGPTIAVTVNGLMGACASVIMLSSPLGAAKDIIKSKNAQALQPVTVGFATINSILWALYGFLTLDMMIAVPNTLCTLACLFQVFLIVRYGRRPIEEVTVSSGLADLPV